MVAILEIEMLEAEEVGERMVRVLVEGDNRFLLT